MDTIKCNSVIESVLNDGNVAVGQYFDSEVLFLKTPIMPPIDDVIKDEIEELKKYPKLKRSLTVILETPGGYIETVERIVDIFRHHFKVVNFVVPNYAYSAGTILALSGDDIFMNYYSVLGPIDPQVDIDGTGQSLPGLGYLAKWEELVRQINDPAKKPEEIRAQLGYLINKFDAATLFTIEQAIEHARQLLREWLPVYKFKNWKITEGSGKKVTLADRRQRASDIADILSDATRWHSHGRGVGMKELGGEEIKLKISNYGDNPELYENISHYYGLLVDYMGKNRYNAALHSRRGVRKLS